MESRFWKLVFVVTAVTCCAVASTLIRQLLPSYFASGLFLGHWIGSEIIGKLIFAVLFFFAVYRSHPVVKHTWYRVFVAAAGTWCLSTQATLVLHFEPANQSLREHWSLFFVTFCAANLSVVFVAARLGAALDRRKEAVQGADDSLRDVDSTGASGRHVDRERDELDLLLLTVKSISTVVTTVTWGYLLHCIAVTWLITPLRIWPVAGTLIATFVTLFAFYRFDPIVERQHVPPDEEPSSDHDTLPPS